MKIPKNICNLIVVTFCIICLSCVSSAPPRFTSDSNGDSKSKTSDRDFNPLELAEDKIIVPKEYPKSGDIVGRLVVSDSTFTPTDSTSHVIADIPAEIDILNNQAFRVQLFSSKVYGDAKKALRIAEEIFDRPLYLDYQVPYFKLRVGNFPNRDKAEEFQMRCKAAGYVNAWVVAVNINIKETAPLYDDLIIPEIIDSLFLYEQQMEMEQENNEDPDDDKE